MVSVEERVKTLELEVAGLKSLLGLSKPRENEWQSTVGMFRDDRLFEEAMKLGREYRESQPPADDREGP